MYQSVKEIFEKKLFSSRENTGSLNDLPAFKPDSLVDLVRAGNPEGISSHTDLQAYELFLMYPQLSENSLRSIIYTAIMQIYFFSTAATEKGVPGHIARSLWESYIMHLDGIGISDTSQVAALCLDAAKSYASLVREYICSGPGAINTTVGGIKEYIHLHLHERIRLKDIADFLFLSTSYCSHAFSESTGTTIGEYIEIEKISEATRLLRTTTLTSSQISQFLTFSSQSYFTKVFHARTGMTPVQYRNNFRNGEKRINVLD